MKKRSLFKKAGAALGLAGALAAFYFTIGCPVAFITGLPCPGCGTTRAWIALFCGDLPLAFAMNPLFLLSSAFVLLLIFKDGRISKNAGLNRALIFSFAFLMLSVYVYRMFSLFPRTQPMVYNGGAVVNKIFKFFEGVFAK